MRSNEFLDRFGKHNACFSRSDAEQRSMKLRNGLLTPRGARGPQAPHLEPVHMARLTIALAAAETAPQAADTVVKYARLTAIGERWFDGADDFEQALTAIFTDSDIVRQVETVSICRSWPQAAIILTDGRQFTFSTLEPPTPEKMTCRIDYRIGSRFFLEINCQLEVKTIMQDLKTKIKTNADSDAYFLYIQRMTKIGEEQGGDAARAWVKANPFQGSKDKEE
ncbi:MAG: hypothetical protein WCO53_14665 [Deltaproteobacteria bacterium]